MKINKIRFKLIYLFILSAALASFCVVFLLLTCLAILTHYGLIDKMIYWMNQHLVVFPIVFLLLMVVLVVLIGVFFLLFTQKSLAYFDEIMTGLQEIAQGELDTHIPERTSDELGKLADNINVMTSNLQKSIAEEHNSEKIKNELINNVSHDLRTPLTSVLGYLELIINNHYNDEVYLQHYADIAFTKCQNLKLMVDDLFEYSKLSSKELSTPKTRIFLGELLEQVMMGFIPVLKASGMEYRSAFTNDKIAVMGEPILLARLFDNLISNAVKYSNNSKYIDIELLKEDNYAVVRIMNYGETIPEDDLPHVFERFYRVEKSRSRQSGGTGLGLAIVKSIADIHNGKVTVSSNNNKTTFEIRLEVE